MKHQVDSSDRAGQIDWLRQEAQTIVMYDQSDYQTPADELVDFWKSQPVEIPEWFDASDESLLRRFVAEAQA